jgi:sugar/nucleoside kinase (ribokinase family)
MAEKIKVSGIGCCLVDLLYNNINFSGDAVRQYLSKERGDGGLSPGKLVFQEEFEQYSGISLDNFIIKLTGGRNCDKINIGGPSIVSLINAAQLTGKEKCEVRFYGRAGNDNNGRYLFSSLGKTPVDIRNYKLLENRTPSTIVLSDPLWDNGHGERMFINSIGAARDYRPEEIDDDFFNSKIIVFGGTALVPYIHDHLTTLLLRAKSKGCITIVNTVFDFRNEKSNPAERWPLGKDDESYRLTDLLITDKEEALRLSGESDIDAAVKFFLGKKVTSLIITNGSSDIISYSDGSFFRASPVIYLPVSWAIRNELKNYTGGDTTGCGDNFVGGVIASVVNDLSNSNKNPDLTEACSWGIVSGGFACFYMGGTYFEEYPGEKLSGIKPYYESYRRQISER